MPLLAALIIAIVAVLAGRLSLQQYQVRSTRSAFAVVSGRAFDAATALLDHPEGVSPDSGLRTAAQEGLAALGPVTSSQRMDGVFLEASDGQAHDVADAMAEQLRGLDALASDPSANDLQRAARLDQLGRELASSQGLVPVGQFPATRVRAVWQRAYGAAVRTSDARLDSAAQAYLAWQRTTPAPTDTERFRALAALASAALATRDDLRAMPVPPEQQAATQAYAERVQQLAEVNGGGQAGSTTASPPDQVSSAVAAFEAARASLLSGLLR